MRVTPRQVPDLRPAAADYTTHCAVCHGAAGRGDGPAAKGLTPPPADLTDAARMGQHSVFGLYNTITLGIKGTGDDRLRAPRARPSAGLSPST